MNQSPTLRNTKDMQAQIQININNFFQLSFLNPDQILSIKSIFNDIHYCKSQKIKQLEMLKRKQSIPENYYVKEKLKIKETHVNSMLRLYRPTSPQRNHQLCFALPEVEELLRQAEIENQIYNHMLNKTKKTKISIEKEINKLKALYDIETNWQSVLNQEDENAKDQIFMINKIQNQKEGQFYNLMKQLKLEKTEKEARKQILVHQIEEIHHDEVDYLLKREELKQKLIKQNAIIQQIENETKPPPKLDQQKHQEIINTHGFIHKVNKQTCNHEEISSMISCLIEEYNSISDQNQNYERKITNLQNNIFDYKIQIQDQNNIIKNEKQWYQKARINNSEIEIIQDNNLEFVTQQEQEEYQLEVKQHIQKTHNIQQFLEFVTYRINHLYQQVEKIRYPKSYLFCDQTLSWPIKDILIKINAQSAVIHQQVNNNDTIKYKTLSTAVISTTDTCVTKYQRIVSAKIQQFQMYNGKIDSQLQSAEDYHNFEQFHRDSQNKSPNQQKELTRAETFYQGKKAVKQYSPRIIRNQIQQRIRSYSRSPQKPHAVLTSGEEETPQNTALNLMNQFKVIPTKLKRSSLKKF